VGERLRGSIGRGAKLKGISVEEATQALVNLAPLKIMVTPEDVAGLCVFLASEEGRHMTGQDVNITGGRCWY
jgi:NAD(P)-dependent dehydrogenase (short-subunit alcohol dehydrogenase family)